MIAGAVGERAAAARPLRCGMGRRRRLAVALAGATLVALACPTSADAFFHGDLAETVFREILEFLIGDVDKLGERLVRGLVGLPLYASGSEKYDALRQYQGYTTALTFGLVPLMFLVGALRYWVTAIGQGSPYEALRIMGRSGIALCGVIAWVPAFDLVTRAFNELAAALLTGPGVGDGLVKVFVGGFAVDSLAGGGVGMLAVVAAVVAAFVLIIVKIVISALLAILFVLGPVALAFWPLEETAWLARSSLYGIFVLMLWPSLWAVCFAVFALLGGEALASAFTSDGGAVQALVALAALVAAWKLPTIVARQALMAGVVPNVAPVRMMAGAYSLRQVIQARTAGVGARTAAGATGARAAAVAGGR